MPTPDFSGVIQQAAQSANVDPRLLNAIIQQESSGNPNAYNPSTGATGLGQQIPATAQALGINPSDPVQSINGAATQLAQNLQRYGNVDDAVKAYFGGTDPKNWGPKTQAYVQQVASRFNQAQPMDAQKTSDPDDDLLAARAAQATAQPAVDPDDQLLMARAQGQNVSRGTSITPSVGTPGQTEQVMEQWMSPQERASAQNISKGVEQEEQQVQQPQGSTGGNVLSGIMRGAVDTGQALGGFGRMIGNTLGLESNSDLDAYMRANAQSNVDYANARQKVGGGTDPGRFIGQAASGAAVMGPSEAIGSAGAGALGRMGLVDAAASPSLDASLLGRMAQNAYTGTGTAALASGQSNTGLGTQLGTGASIAAGLSLVSPLAGKVIGAFAKPIDAVLDKGGSTATPSAEESSEAMRQAAPNIMDAVSKDAQGNTTIDPTKLPPNVQDLLTNGPLKNLPPDQQARALTFESLGVKNYTLADLTRNYGDAATERNLAQNVALGQPLRDADMAKNEQLLDAANASPSVMGAQPAVAHDMGSAIRQHLLAQRSVLDKGINEAYTQADQAASGQPQVSMAPIVQALQGQRSQFLAQSDGQSLLNGIRARMQEFAGGPPKNPGAPIITDTNGTPLLNSGDVPPATTFGDSERFRQFLNSVSTPDNNYLIRPLKAAVDQAQDQAGGGQLYQQARLLRQQRAQQFENQSGIAQILAQKPGGDFRMPANKIVNTYANGDVDQLGQLVNQLNQGGQEGQSVLNQLRATVMQNAVNKSTSVIPGQKGQGAFSGANFAKQLDQLGPTRINTLFTPEQQNYLGTLKRGALDLTTSPPISNAYNPSGTAAQSANLMDSLASMPNPPGWLKKGASMAVGKIPVVGNSINELGKQAADRATQAAQAQRAALAASPLSTLSAAQAKALQQQRVNQLIGQKLLNPGALGGALQPASP